MVAKNQKEFENIMNTITIIQARMGSGRLPGKVLKHIGGKPALTQLVDRLKLIKSDNEIIVATTVLDEDDKIIDFCVENNIRFFRGSENDVLKRVHDCAVFFKADWVIDITGDCPLVDPAMIDLMLYKLQTPMPQNGNGSMKYLEYISNTMIRTYPDGLDVQIYKYALLERINDIVEDEKHRCHTGWNIFQYLYNIPSMNVSIDSRLTHPEWGLTLDTVEDLQVLDIIFTHFKNQYFSTEDVIEYLLANPKILEINNHIKRKIPGEG